MKKIIFINIFLIITIIIFAETAIRFLGLASLQGADKNLFFMENDIILHKPNFSSIVAGKKVRTDENGFRVPAQGVEVNSKLKSKLILGDSVSFGFGVNEKDSFIGIIRNELDINLHNTSVIGHNLQSYIYLINKYSNNSNLEIEKIIIFLCLNDIHIQQGVSLKNELQKNLIPPSENFIVKFLKKDIFTKINLFLREKSALFVFLKSVSTNAVKRHYEYMSWRYNDDNLLSEYSKSIKKISDLSKFKNLKAEFVLLPYAYQVQNHCEKKYMKPQKKIKKIFDKLDINLYDFSANFCSNSTSNNFFIGFDPVHLSKTGHEFVSRLLIENKIIN